jgi:hypothetical protein
MRRRLVSFLLWTLVLTLWTSPICAQTTLGNAAVSGTVRDSTGAAIGGARVILIEKARSLVRESSSNDSGLFLFPTVPPGAYTLRVTKEGFDATELNDIVLEVGQRASLDVTLNVGQMSTVVTVSAESQLRLETESNVIGTVVDSARVQELPLNGRNFLQLALLSGGSVPPTGKSDAISGQTGRSNNAVLLAGNPGSSTGYLINGIATRGGRLGESALNISVAAIDQFKVQMSFFMPDQGPNPGLVNLTTKGGSNRIHGEAFEFVRNQAFDSRNFFSPGPEKLHRNQFGAAVGGPIRKDRVWFFANYEGLREVTALTASNYAPTQAMFGGNFTENADPIFDPSTYSSATGQRQAFPNKIIPAERINAVSKNLLKYYRPGASLAQRPANIFGNPRFTSNDDQYGIRIDSSLTAKQNLYGQFLSEKAPIVSPGLMPYSGGLFPMETKLIMLQHTYTVTPRLISVLRLGAVRNLVFSSNEGSTLGSILPSIGIPNTLDTRGVTGIGIQGFAGIGRSAGDIGNIDNNYQFDEGITYVRGAHNFQFGASIRYRRTWQQNANANSLGNLGFQPTFTAQLAPNAQGRPAPQARTGSSFADFLLGYNTTGQLIGLPLLPYRFTQYMPYLQDTWKIARNFTLNYGISWFLDTVPNPHAWASRLPHGFDYQSGLLKYAALGEVDPRILSMEYKNLTPRLGFAWKPSFLPNTVIRSGAGLYFSDSRLIEAQFAMIAPPFNTPLVVNNNPLNPFPDYELGRNIFPPQPQSPLNSSYAANLPNGTSAFLLEPNGKTPYVWQWNFSVQHSIRQNDLVELVYIGASSHRQQNRYEASMCRPGPDLRCDPATKPYPRYSNLLTSDFNGNGSYEAAIARYHHQTSAGLDLRFEYTIAKSINDNFLGGANDEQITTCRRCDKSVSSFDVRHRAVVSAIYRLPIGKGRALLGSAPVVADAILGGWSITAITTFQTGVPFDVTSPNTTGVQNITVRANRLCDGRDSSLSGNLRNNGMRYFDTSCFAATPVGYFGNAGRNVLYGPGINNWDTGIEKFFPIPLREQMRLQFRAELFNTWNHAQFNAPNSATNTTNFGLISSARAPRLVQFGMKLLF